MMFWVGTTDTQCSKPCNRVVRGGVRATGELHLGQDAEVDEIVDKRRDEIEAELADVGMLLAYLCHDLGVDLASAVSRKLDANALKYPVEKSRGRSEKYTRL